MSLRSWLAFGLIMLLLPTGSGIASTTGDDDPVRLVQRLIQAIGSMKPVTNGQLSEADRARNASAAKIATTLLDVPDVSRRTLGRYWKKRSVQEQHEFTALLEALFVKVAFPKSSEFFNDYQVNVTGESVTGQRAVVKTTVTHPKEGLIGIDYRLRQNAGSWLVRDILLDDVSLALNLRSQFRKIITEHSYEELLRRMREKLTEYQ